MLDQLLNVVYYLWKKKSPPSFKDCFAGQRRDWWDKVHQRENLHTALYRFWILQFPQLLGLGQHAVFFLPTLIIFPSSENPLERRQSHSDSSETNMYSWSSCHIRKKKIYLNRHLSIAEYWGKLSSCRVTEATSVSRNGAYPLYIH